MNVKFSRNRFAICICIPLLLLVAACDDNDLATAGKALRDTAATLEVLQETVIAGNANGLISDNVTRPILLACVRINQVGLEAVEITRRLNTMTPEARGQLTAILAPVITELQLTIANDLVRIGDPATKAKVQVLLLGIQTSLNTAQLATAIKQ